MFLPAHCTATAIVAEADGAAILKAVAAVWYCGALAGAPARATPARLLRLRPLRPDAVLVPLRWPD